MATAVRHASPITRRADDEHAISKQEQVAHLRIGLVSLVKCLVLMVALWVLIGLGQGIRLAGE